MHQALDFIENAVDAADDGIDWNKEVLAPLRRLFIKAKEDRHNKRVKYYVRKLKKKPKAI